MRVLLTKARKGEQRGGKYKRRIAKPGGGFRYVYDSPKSKSEAPMESIKRLATYGQDRFDKSIQRGGEIDKLISKDRAGIAKLAKKMVAHHEANMVEGERTGDTSKRDMGARNAERWNAILFVAKSDQPSKPTPKQKPKPKPKSRKTRTFKKFKPGSMAGTEGKDFAKVAKFAKGLGSSVFVYATRRGLVVTHLTPPATQRHMIVDPDGRVYGVDSLGEREVEIDPKTGKKMKKEDIPDPLSGGDPNAPERQRVGTEATKKMKELNAKITRLLKKHKELKRLSEWPKADLEKVEKLSKQYNHWKETARMAGM